MSRHNAVDVGKTPRYRVAGRVPGFGLLLARVFILAGAGCRFAADDRRAIEGALADQASAWNRGDIEGFLRVYEQSEALVFTSGGQIRRGFAAARERYLERYAARGKETMGHLEFEVVDVRGLGPRAAVVLGRWRLTETDVGGAGVFTLAFHRDGRRWFIVHDHTTLDTSASQDAVAPEKPGQAQSP
jgi:beta-aspartyl-peptidase (threonine type)